MNAALTVHYDETDRAWVAVRDGEELGRNHRLDEQSEFLARQWAAWLVGAEIPLSDIQQRTMSQLESEPEPVRDLVYRVYTGGVGRRTDEFFCLQAGVSAVVVCTSLSDEEALARARSTPSGTSGGWLRADHEDAPCPAQPGTHRHVIFEAD